MNRDHHVPRTAAAAIEAGVPRFRAFREARMISPSAVGQSTDISAERMLQIEEGAVPTERELLDISNALGIPVAILAAR